MLRNQWLESSNIIIHYQTCNSNSPKMATSNYSLAKRAFISVLLSLARAYHLIVDVNRDSSDPQVQKAYRRVLLKVHPDKGGRK